MLRYLLVATCLDPRFKNITALEQSELVEDVKSIHSTVIAAVVEISEICYEEEEDDMVRMACTLKVNLA